MSVNVAEYAKNRRQNNAVNKNTVFDISDSSGSAKSGAALQNSGVSVAEYSANRKKAQLGSYVNSEITDFYNSYSSLIKEAEKRYSSTGYRAESSEWLSKVTEQSLSAAATAKKIRRDISEKEGTLGKETVDSILQMLDSIGNSYKSLWNAADKDYQVFSQFADENEYNTASTTYEMQKKASALSLDEIKAELQKVKKAKKIAGRFDTLESVYKGNGISQKEYDRVKKDIQQDLEKLGFSSVEEVKLWESVLPGAQNNAYGDFDTNKGASELEALQSELAKLEADRNRALEIRKELTYAQRQGNSEKEESLKEELKALSPDGSTDEEAVMAYFNQKIPSVKASIKDAEGNLKSAQKVQALNSLGDVVFNPDFEYYSNRGAEMFGNKVMGVKSGKSAKELGISEDDYYRYKQMTDDEVALYNYYNSDYYDSKNRKDGQAMITAEQYIDELDKSFNSLTARAAQAYYEEVLKDKSNIEKVFSSVGANLERFGQNFGRAIEGFVVGFNDPLYEGKSYYRGDVSQGASAIAREDLGALGKLSYDALGAASYMLPSVLSSAIVGTVSKSAGAATFANAVMMGVPIAGQAYEEMINLGYSRSQAKTYGVLAGASEFATEIFLNGAGKGLGKLVAPFASSIDKVMGTLAINNGSAISKFIASAGSEALEEMVQEVIDPVLKSIATGDIQDAATVEQVLYAGLLGAITSAGINAVDVAFEKVGKITANKNTYTANEQVVFDSVVEKRIEELKQSGEKVTAEREKAIKKNVKEEFEAGEISTSDIEEALGDRKVFEADRRILQSYWEKGQKSEKFEADLSKYSERGKAVVQSAIDSGILNNSGRTHKFVDFVAKIAEDKGITFDFLNNEKLKESGFAIDGKEVAGYVNGNKISVNIDSSKALNSVIGHEIMHVFEGTEFYDAIKNTVREYATTKGEWDTRLQATSELYKGVSNDAESELIADLIGDYLFTDLKFLERLSVENRNVFQKLWDEINYLCRIATAGSKEARLLEKVKKAFEDAYRNTETAEKNTAEDGGGVRYSLNRKISKEEIKSNIETVANMETVATLDGSEFEKSEIDLITQVEGFFNSLNNVVETKYGKVNLTKTGAKASLGHGIGRNKAIAFKAVPDVINKGEVIDYHENWKNRGYGRVVFSAPISIKGTNYFMAVVVNVEATENSYYLHEVALQKREGYAPFKTGTVKDGASGDASPSIYSLLQLLQDVKNNSMQEGGKNSLVGENANRPAGNYNVYGKDVKYSGDDLAPVREDIDTLKRSATDEDYKAGYDFLLNGEEVSEADADRQRIEDFEALSDEDEADFRQGDYIIEDETPTTVISEQDLRYITNILKDTLYLNPRQVGEAKQLVREYLNNPDKKRLREEIQNRFGTKKFIEKIDEIAEVKAELRGRNIKVSDDIKNDIGDYEQFRKSLFRKLSLKDEGTPVDILYAELSSDYPELFTNDIVNQSDQLKRIAEVVNTDTYNRGEYEFDEDVIQKAVDVIADGAERYSKPEAKKKGQPLSVEERVAKRREELNSGIKAEQSAKDKSFDNFTLEIDRLTAEYDALNDKNSKKAIDLQYQIQEKRRERTITDEEYDGKIKSLHKSLENVENGTYETSMRAKLKNEELKEEVKAKLGNTSTWQDKSTGLAYKINTERRNLQDVVRDENGKSDLKRANEIDDWLSGEYNHNEALLNKESARIKKQFADMKINPVESEYIQMLGEYRHNPETTLTEDAILDFYVKNCKKIDELKVEKAIELSRQVYDELFERVNEVLKEHGMKEIPYRKGYFPHFTEENLSVFNKLFNWKKKNNDIPTDIAGQTEMFNPQRSWQSFNKRREGDTTSYNFLEGFDRYVQGALDWIYHIEDIQKRRAVENYIRYTHSEKGVQEQINKLESRDDLSADEIERARTGIYSEAQNPLGRFLIDFRARTNTLAGKKSTYDRSMEEMTNRNIYTTVENLQARNAANMVVGSLSAAITNLIPITQSWAEISPVRTLSAIGETIRSIKRDDGVTDKSDYLTNRLNAAEKLNKTKWDKVIDKVGIMMEAIDWFSSQVIWRSKYNQNIDKGMSENAAIKNADQFSEGLMAGRSRGNMPTLFDSKNIIYKCFTAFQLEVNNQYEYMFKDLPRNMKNESIGKLAVGFVKLFVGAYVYDKISKMLTGRTSAFDPIGIIEELLKDLGVGGDDDDKEEKWTDAVINFGDNVVKELPFIGGYLGGGRVPISSSIPYGNPVDFVKEGVIKDFFGGEDIGKFGKEIATSAFYLLPNVGGGQLKKTVEGASMYLTSDKRPIAGSYSDSGALRFPAEKDALSVAQALLFGQWSSKNAQDYFDEGRKPLTEKQLGEFVELGDDMTIQEYWDYLDDMSKLKTAQEKTEYINSLDLSLKKKNILISNALNRAVDLTGYDKFSGFAEWDFSIKNEEKYKFLQDNRISYASYISSDEAKETYDEVFTWYKNNPEKATLSKAVTDTVVEYREITKALGEIRADKDENGNAISGSAKEKKVDYINSLDIDYGAKLILYKDLYPKDNSYNFDIIDYLEERDLTSKERKTVLEELGFKVDSDGRVSW